MAIFFNSVGEFSLFMCSTLNLTLEISLSIVLINTFFTDKKLRKS